MDNLTRTLTLKDLTFFGVASIMGSGGFSLIGKAVRAGGSRWPYAFSIASILLLGASYAYSCAFRKFQTNTSESDIVREIFGDRTQWMTSATIVAFNILSITTILVMCSHMIFQKTAWIRQITLALTILAGMSLFALQGIEVNKEVINIMAIGLIGLLTLISALGYQNSAHPTPSSQSTSFSSSVLLFFFVLAGFDVLMKFTEESKEKKDIPLSFFSSNILSDIFTFGIAITITSILPHLTESQEENALTHVFERLWGNSVAEGFTFAMIAFMVLSTFVVFLAVSRYMYGLHEVFKPLNSANVPYVAILVITIIVASAILINNIDSLIRLSDLGLILTLMSVSAATSVSEWKDTNYLSASANGATTLGLGSLLFLF